METKLSKDKTSLYYAKTWWKLPFRQVGYFVHAANNKHFVETNDVEVAKEIATMMNLLAKHSN